MPGLALSRTRLVLPCVEFVGKHYNVDVTIDNVT